MAIRQFTGIFLGSWLIAAQCFAAESWHPSKYGAGDTLGAINNLSPEKVVEAARLVKTGKTYALASKPDRIRPLTRPANTR